MVVSVILINNPTWENTPATQYGIFVAMTMFAPLSMICVSNRYVYILLGLICLVA